MMLKMRISGKLHNMIFMIWPISFLSDNWDDDDGDGDDVDDGEVNDLHNGND